MSSPSQSASILPEIHASGSPRDHDMELEPSGPEEMDVDEPTEEQSVSNHGHQRNHSEPSMSPSKRVKGNDGQRQCHPHGLWVHQAAAFHSGRLIPAVRVIQWPAPSDFDAFFQQLTGDTGLAIAQERIYLARYYTVSPLVDHGFHGAGPLTWGELSLSARLNIIGGLEEIEAMAKYLQTDGEADPKDWEAADTDAGIERDTLQYAQTHLADAQNWWDYTQLHPRLPQTILQKPTATQTSIAGPPPTTVTQEEKVKKDNSGKTSSNFVWENEELEWCRAYIKDQKDRFVKPTKRADTDTKVDWTIWSATNGDESKCSASLKQMQIDHHNHFKGRAFPRRTKKVGEYYDPRPNGTTPHRSCLSFWKKLVVGVAKGDLEFCQQLSAINSKYKHWEEKAAEAAAEAAVKARAGSDSVSAGTVHHGNTLPNAQGSRTMIMMTMADSQVSTAESSPEVEQQNALANRPQGELTVPGFQLTGDDALTLAPTSPTSVGPREPARRDTEIDEDYDEGMESEEQEEDVDTAPVPPVHPAPAPFPSSSEDMVE
ncbi:hypothetical protein E6O75_ATG10600 [Venturia nashicola]|uniref:Uncharacterized protein n=1 Tax=Venturia nashicola TaxID=86259 RepID=A0A4Z1P9D1_9PEZI|nr:hypothetical protein E6O75_ATG10600 [Venturia nashicola]